MEYELNPSQTSNRATAPDNLKRVVSRIYDLPSFPVVITKLAEVAENPDSSCKDLAKVMANDQGLSAKVLKLVNSAFYSFSTPVSSLQHAITLLGYNTVRSLALSVSVKGMFKDAVGFPQERFWLHSLAAALGAKILAERNRFPMKDDVFTAGLLHDVGFLLEARYFPEQMSQIMEAVSSGELAMADAEDRYLGVTHNLLGAWLAEKWRLPGFLREPILRHHDFEAQTNDDIEALSPEERQSLAFVTLSNLIVRGMGYTMTQPGDDEAKITIPQHLQPYLGEGPISDLIPQIEEELASSQEFLKL